MKQMDRKVMLQKFTDDVSTEVRMLETRLLRTIANCESIAHDPRTDAMAKLDAERLKIDCSIILVRMFREGPRIFNVAALEQKEQHQLGVEYQQTDI
jgi:hypothetical protein